MLLLGVMKAGVVGGAGVPAGPDDADPSAGDDASGMRVPFASSPGVGRRGSTFATVSSVDATFVVVAVGFLFVLVVAELVVRYHRRG